MEVLDKGWVYNGVEFNVGDRVQIFTTEVSEAEDAMGPGTGQWPNTWVDQMDYAVGGIHEIEEIREEGVGFVSYVDENTLHPHMGYLFPLSVLVKVE